MATTPEATQEVRDVLAGRPGGVNRVIKRFGKHIVDYATALIPDRAAPFDRMVEDILTDIVSQCRAAARSQSDDEVFEFGVEAALRTVRARYPEVLEADARPSRATSSWSFNEVMKRTKLSSDELSRGISEGRIKAVRQNDEMRIKGDGVGLGERKAFYAYHVSAAERELLVLHFRLGFSPETIARWAGVTTAQIEERIGKAAGAMATGMAKKQSDSPDREDTAMRRYIDGRMQEDETVKFERGILKDKIAQRRLDELRGQSQAIKELFDGDPYDLSSVAVNVRARNPHHAIALPPVAALWLQVVGIAAIMLVFHSVGAYIAPPDVRVSAARGEVQLPAEGRMSVGDSLETPAGAQALLILDESNRVLMAPDSKLKLLEPRPEARQVLGLERGEVWGRFTSAGHAFVIEFPGAEDELYEISSDGGADFDLIVGEQVNALLPENLHTQRLRAFVSEFGADLTAGRDLARFAGFRIGNGDNGIVVGDVIERIDGITIRNLEDLANAVGAIDLGTEVQMSIRRGNERVAVALERVAEVHRAVLRVFHGSVRVGRVGGELSLVNSKQWALLSDGQAPLVGIRGMEDFRVLRIDATERFKDVVHWLNVESYPLRAENSVLLVDRGLRELAESLEAMRAQEIRRSGEREIREFETLMRELIVAAKRRHAAGTPREGDGEISLSDAQLIAGEDEILGTIVHWRHQAGNDIHPTLGSAAKTLQSRISRDRETLEAIGSDMTRAILYQERIEELDGYIETKNEEIAELKQSPNYDETGEKRHELEARIAELREVVKKGDAAQSRIELLTITLNEFDSRLDDERRKLPALREAIQSAETRLAEINADIKANIYTPEKLAAARAGVASAKESIKNAKDTLAERQDELEAAEARAETAREALNNAREPIATLEAARDAAGDRLTDALAERTKARDTLNSAQAEVDRLQDELDAMPEDDPARADKQSELEEATKARDKAAGALEDAQEEADGANTEVETADKALEEAEENIESKRTDLAARQKELATAKERRLEAEGRLAELETALETREQDVQNLETARTEREALLEAKETTQDELSVAQADLDTVEEAIAALEKEAEPRRETLREELQLVEAGEDAAADIEDLQTQHARHQAVSDAIERRLNDRASLETERDQIADSTWVTEYDQMKEDYTDLSRRIGALEFLQARALLEDQSFEHEQKAAQDRFREATTEARRDAVALLNDFCPPYRGEEYEIFRGEDGEKLREAVLGALWKLYYDSGADGGSDDGELICYYVAVQSGAPRRAFEQLDSRWKSYLTEALGKEAFETVSGLEPGHLQRGAKKED